MMINHWAVCELTTWSIRLKGIGQLSDELEELLTLVSNYATEKGSSICQ